MDGNQTFILLFLLCDYSILWRGNFSCLELKKEEENSESLVQQALTCENNFRQEKTFIAV